MGLDIFLYHAKRIKDMEPGTVITMEEFNKNYPHGNAIDPAGPSAQVKTIKNLGVQVKIAEKMLMAPLVAKIVGNKDIETILCSSSSVTDNGGLEITVECYDKTGKKLSDVKLNDEQISRATGDVYKDYIVFDTEEIAYQRKGLNDKGWALLPENCEYSDNKTTIRKLIQFGGLGKEFLDNWIDGESLFLAWW